MEINALKSTSTPAASTQAAGGKNAELGKDQFLKLFVAQLQHQDPMNPMQDQDFMGQMASFSTLEQVTNMAKANEAIASNLSLTQSGGGHGPPGRPPRPHRDLDGRREGGPHGPRRERQPHEGRQDRPDCQRHRGCRPDHHHADRVTSQKDK
jgi:hypothetical protein